MGVLSKALAVLLAVNMAVMFALPIGIFADEVTLTDDIEVTYEESEPAAEDAEAEKPPEVVTPSGEESAQTPAENAESTPQGGFQPMAITPMDVGDRQVTNWDQFLVALEDAAVTRIVINTARLDATSDATVSRTVEVEGNGNILNMGSRGLILGTGGTATDYKTFKLTNMYVTKTGSNNLVYSSSGAYWNMNFNGVTSTTSTTSPIVSMPWGVINFTGTNNWTIPGTYAIISGSRYVNFTGGDTTLKGAGRVISSTLSDSSIHAKADAKVMLKSTGTGDVEAIYLCPGSDTSTPPASAGYAVIISTDGADLTIEGSGAGIGSTGGVVALRAYSGGFRISDGGKVTVSSLQKNSGQPAVVQQITNGTFDVTGEGSRLDLISWGNDNDWGATLRFRYGGGQKFNVSDKAVVNIVKEARTTTGSNTDPAALRFGDAAGNEFHVTGGAQVYVTNKGNATFYNATNDDGENAAIEYDHDTFVFDVSGNKSAIILDAYKGPAVDASNKKYGSITLGQGSIFIARGCTKDTAGTASSAIFRAGDGFRFTATNPLYYDFVNVRTTGGGGRIFSISSDGIDVDQSRFYSGNSDVAIWGNGSNSYRPYGTGISGNPYGTWSRVTYSLYGANLDNLWEPDDPSFATGFGTAGINIYTRISGNNANPVIGPIIQPYNTDKRLIARATVPEGLDATGRGAWDNEVYARIQVTPYDDPSNPYVIEVQSKETVALYEPYGDPASMTMDGAIVFTVPDDKFLRTGDQYQVIDAWRGNADPDSPKAHRSTAEDIDSTTRTVEDKTPPTPVEITSPEDGTIWTNQRIISGTYTDMAADPADAYNHEPVDYVYAKVMRGDKVIYTGDHITPDSASLTWSITLASTMIWQDGDKLSIIAVDTTGNENPVTATATSFHDATFPPAASLDVKEFPVELSANNVVIGLEKAREIQAAGDTAAVNNELRKLIDAKAAIKPLKTYAGTLTVSVIKNDNFADEIYTLEGWAHGANTPKSFTITYQLDSYPSITKTATVVVFPREVVDPDSNIAANNITLSENNAIALLKKDPVQLQYDQLLVDTDAMAFDITFDENNVATVTLRPDDVKVASHLIKGEASTPPHYPIVLARISNPTKTFTVRATVIKGAIPILNVSTPIHIWIGDEAERD
ncbi:MAG: hypothetical protein LBK67_03305, partial [Coriobacteriales bacterium]|nr:hypothetical protein [Coriobacteriales bacterium]